MTRVEFDPQPLQAYAALEKAGSLQPARDDLPRAAASAASAAKAPRARPARRAASSSSASSSSARKNFTSRGRGTAWRERRPGTALPAVPVMATNPQSSAPQWQRTNHYWLLDRARPRAIGTISYILLAERTFRFHPMQDYIGSTHKEPSLRWYMINAILVA